MKRLTPLPRTPFRASPKARRRRESHMERMAVVRPLVFARAAFRCEARFSSECMTGRWWLEAHHRKPSGQGGPDTAANVVALCQHCHFDVHHRRPGAAREAGLLIPSWEPAPDEPWEPAP